MRDFTNLISLTTIGNFFIQNSLTSFNGLSSLTSIYYIFFETTKTFPPKLTSFTGLESLLKLYSVYITSGNSLLSLQGLNNVTNFSGPIVINNSSISILDGFGSNNGFYLSGADFTDNPNLTDISQLSNCTDVFWYVELDPKDFSKKMRWDSYLCKDGFKSDLVMYFTESPLSTEEAEYKKRTYACDRPPVNVTPQNDCLPGYSRNITGTIDCSSMGLDSLSDGWQYLNSVDRLDLSHNVLPNLNGLSGLTKVGELVLDANYITSFFGLSSLKEIGTMVIAGNNNLLNLEGLNSLTKIDNLTIYNGLNMTSISGLENLVTAGDIKITSMSLLSSIDALESLQTANTIDLENTRVTAIDGMNSLTLVTGSLILKQNSISEIKGLTSLETIGGDLDLSFNDITSITGLNKLSNVGGSIILTSSGNISDLSWLDNVTVQGSLILDNCSAIINKISQSAYICQNPDKINGYLYSEVCQE